MYRAMQNWSDLFFSTLDLAQFLEYLELPKLSIYIKNFIHVKRVLKRERVLIEGPLPKIFQL